MFNFIKSLFSKKQKSSTYDIHFEYEYDVIPGSNARHFIIEVIDIYTPGGFLEYNLRNLFGSYLSKKECLDRIKFLNKQVILGEHKPSKDLTYYGVTND
jgi:hypothetical protein